jgi:hypothetical protein
MEKKLTQARRAALTLLAITASLLLLKTLAVSRATLPLMFFDKQEDANNPEQIPTDGLPKGRVERNFQKLKELGLLDRELSVAESRLPWSASFFPVWYGGVAGRWQDSLPTLLLRTLFGVDTIKPARARALLEAAAKGDEAARRELYRLSPVEKYDLAVGDYDFHATELETLRRGHNINEFWGDLPFWSGYCNGVAEASTLFPEPVKEVDVRNPDGYVIRFHPYDIKALLALAWVKAGTGAWRLGARCNSWSLDSDDCADMNPGALAIAIANQIGIARRPFIADKNPLAPVINVAVGKARIDVARGPYTPPRGTDERAASLVDVHFTLGTSSTQLPYPRTLEPTGFREERLAYNATLALDKRGEIVGGRWNAPLFHGPDFIWGGKGEAIPPIEPWGHLNANGFIQWEVLKRLQERSVRPSRGSSPAALGDLIGDNAIFGFTEKMYELRVRHGFPVRVYGFLTEKTARRTSMIVLTTGPRQTPSVNDAYLGSFEVPASVTGTLIFSLRGEASAKRPVFLKARLQPRGGAAEIEDITSPLSPER